MAQSTVMYFMVKSCIHTVWPLENDQNVPYLSPLLLASIELCENIEITRQLANYAARLKIPWKTVVHTDHI